MPAVGYGAAWLRAFLNRSSGLSFDSAQATRIAALAERKLVDLFDVAEETALADGRTHVLRHDLPLTRGCARYSARWNDWLSSWSCSRCSCSWRRRGARATRRASARGAPAADGCPAAPHRTHHRRARAGGQRLERLLRPTPEGPTRWEVERAERVLNMTI
jgi:hypothetical protein